MKGDGVETLDNIEVVVKISERCNTNCSYCYMVNQGNAEYLGRPAYMMQETISVLGRFLLESARQHHTEAIHIIFHGGEPMMMKPERFDEVRRELEEALNPQVHLRFSMQTNAILVDDRWLAVLIEHDVGVGVSIDGPLHYHDVDRLDHKGEGSYQRVVRGLRKLQSAVADDLLKPVGAIAVIRPAFSGEVVFDHLVNDLGVRRLSFLLPIDTHDTFGATPTAGYGEYLIGAYRAWARRGDKGIRVRFIDETLGFLTGGEEIILHMRDAISSFALFVVGSNGDLEADDALKPLAASDCKRPSIFTHGLADFLSTPEMVALREAMTSLPSACMDCCWQNGCRGSGGRLVNRYSEARGFDNPSFLCSSLKAFYSNAAAGILAAGFPREQMLRAMCASPLPAMRQRPDCSAFGPGSGTGPARIAIKPLRA